MAPLLHPDRLLPSLPDTRAIARRLYDGIKDLPIVSPHGHTDPRWYAENEAFPDPSTLFVVPDHYIFRHDCRCEGGSDGCLIPGLKSRGGS